MIYGRQLLHSFLVTSMYTHTYIVSFYQQKDIFVFVGETYAHSNPLLILVNLCEVSSIHFITMMDHHWGGSWGGGEHIYIYIEINIYVIHKLYMICALYCLLFTSLNSTSTFEIYTFKISPLDCDSCRNPFG